MSDIKVLGDNVLVRRVTENRLTLTGIILTSSVEKECRGEVLAVGPTTSMVRVGDIVHLPKYPDREITQGSRVAELHREWNIIAKYE